MAGETSTLSNHFKYMMATGNIDFDGDTFKMVLLSGEPAFDKDAHAVLTDLIDYEISAGGYTASGETLSGVSVTEDDANDKASVTWDNVTYTASGESIYASTAIIYDDTSSDDTIVGATEFGSVREAADGTNLVVQSLQVALS